MAEPPATTRVEAPGAAGPRWRSLGPVLLLGLGAAALAAVGGNQTWATAGDVDGSAGGAVASVVAAAREGEAPLVTAVALVVLAAWGVLLVARGRFRRAMAWGVAASSLCLLVAAVAAWWAAPGTVQEAFEPYGVTDVDAGRTAWSWVSVGAAALALAAGVLAVRGVRSWPEMGRRYDAPTPRTAPAVTGDERGGASGDAEGDRGADGTDRDSLELWTAIEQGRDPTDLPADAAPERPGPAEAEEPPPPDAPGSRPAVPPGP